MTGRLEAVADATGASNPFALTGKVALITGGGRGMGEGIALAMSEAGAAVSLVARTKDQLDKVAADVIRTGGRALAMPADVRHIEVLDSLIEKTVDEFGGLDIVVNCAGGGDMWHAFLDNTEDDLEAAFHFNVTVPFALVRKAVPRLLERPGASVVNIVSGAIDQPTRGHLTYDAAKGALYYATRSMAASLGPRIRVNGLMPGLVDTEAMRAVTAKHENLLEQLIGQTRMRRFGTPRDVGLAAVYLASPAASWVTGVLLDIDGGSVGELIQMFPDL